VLVFDLSKKECDGSAHKRADDEEEKANTMVSIVIPGVRGVALLIGRTVLAPTVKQPMHESEIILDRDCFNENREKMTNC
jgi:hypothetical protein